MRSGTPPQPRERHYVPRLMLGLLIPLTRYSGSRDAYVLRLVGNSRGPVLKADRRRGSGGYQGTNRRAV